jgi:hypothetical protein
MVRIAAVLVRKGLVRLFVLALAVGGAVAVVALSGGDSPPKPTPAERAAAERTRLRKLHAAMARVREAELRDPVARRERARLRAEQKPVFGRGRPAGGTRAGQTRLVTAVERAITRDARARFRAGKLDRRPLDAECLHLVRPNVPHPPPPPVTATTAGYECTAVVDRLTAPKPTIVGFPYWARLSFRTGRYAFCKINLLPSEHGIGAQTAFVPLEPVCDLVGRAGPA